MDIAMNIKIFRFDMFIVSAAYMLVLCIFFNPAYGTSDVPHMPVCLLMD